MPSNVIASEARQFPSVETPRRLLRRPDESGFLAMTWGGDYFSIIVPRNGWLGRSLGGGNRCIAALGIAVDGCDTLPARSERLRIEVVERMTAVNALPTTRTPRYVVVARKATR